MWVYRSLCTNLYNSWSDNYVVDLYKFLSKKYVVVDKEAFYSGMTGATLFAAFNIGFIASKEKIHYSAYLISTGMTTGFVLMAICGVKSRAQLARDRLRNQQAANELIDDDVEMRPLLGHERDESE